MRERKQYILHPKVSCSRGGCSFERDLEPCGQLGIYLHTKMTKTEADDLIFYLEQKMPYINGVDAVSFTIYAVSGAQDKDVFWSGRFRNHLAPVQKYRDDNFIKFLR